MTREVSTTPRVRQAPDRIDVRTVVGLGVLALAAFAAAVVVAWWYTPGETVGRAPVGPATTPLDGLDRAPLEGEESAIARADRERSALERWEWVDRDAGLVAIPITRAMQLVSSGVRRPTDDSPAAAEER